MEDLHIAAVEPDDTEPEDVEEPSPCEWIIFSATQIDPAEYCEDVAEPGERYCAAHLPWDD